MKAVSVSKSDRKFFGRALEAARLGEHERVRVGAVLVRGKLHVTGHNRVAHGFDGPFKEGHAERRVIADVPAFKCTLYVARIGLNDEPLASWPCAECMFHIIACACVSKIVYHDGAEIKKVRL